MDRVLAESRGECGPKIHSNVFSSVGSAGNCLLTLALDTATRLLPAFGSCCGIYVDAFMFMPNNTAMPIHEVAPAGRKTETRENGFDPSLVFIYLFNIHEHRQ